MRGSCDSTCNKELESEEKNKIGGDEEAGEKDESAVDLFYDDKNEYSTHDIVPYHHIITNNERDCHNTEPNSARVNFTMTVTYKKFLRTPSNPLPLRLQW